MTTRARPHGGPRAGAGRKPRGAEPIRSTLAIALPRSMLAELRALAAAEGVSVSECVRRALVEARPSLAND